MEDLVRYQEVFSMRREYVYCASMVVLMQLGFTFLEVGSVRVNFTKGILMKNILDMALSSVLYYLFGFAVSFGDSSSTAGLFGTTHFLLLDTNETSSTEIDVSYAGWFYHWSYCATALTVLAGAIAERTRLCSYLVYTAFGSTVVYPVVSHWIWSSTGWASPLNKHSSFIGAIDDTGGIAVHTCAGTASLIACYIVGPRHHRLSRDGKLRKDVPKQSHSFIVFGMFVLWFSWYAFNAGPTISMGHDMSLERPDVIGRVAVYTTLCAGSAGLTFVLLDAQRKGLVSSTSGCTKVPIYLALVIGPVGSVLMYFTSKLLVLANVDDVVDAVSVHLSCGIWSALSAALFAETFYTAGGVQSCGMLTGCPNGPLQFGVNILLCILTVLYVSVITGTVFWLLSFFKVLRITVESENAGVDMVEFEGSAYNTGTGSTRKKKKRRALDIIPDDIA